MSSKYIGFILTEELKDKLLKLAEKNQRSLSNQIRLLLEKALTNE